MFYFFTILFYICSFSLPELCCDPIINSRNIDEEFIIDNVCGIGRVVIPDEFRQIIKSTITKPMVSGRFIHDEFEEYVRVKLGNPTKALIHKLRSIIYSNNKYVNKLMSFDELLYVELVD